MLGGVTLVLSLLSDSPLMVALTVRERGKVKWEGETIAEQEIHPGGKV